MAGARRLPRLTVVVRSRRADAAAIDFEVQGWDDPFQPAFWEAKRAMTRAAEAAFTRHGVRDGQQFVLMCLWREDGLGPGEIARRIDVAAPAVTRTVGRMTASGLVERRPHPTDAHQVRVHLTERGWALRDILNAEMEHLSERALRGLDPGERATFVRMLRRLRDNLNPPPGPTPNPPASPRR